MNNVVQIDDLLSEKENWQVIDVRSPGEFTSGHIPGAINIPLFSDEERKRVGTLYKQVSPDAAMKEGLAIAGNQLHHYVKSILPFTRDEKKKIIIHCWRGGKRSQALHWLYSFAGINCFRLHGGYKSYRQALQDFFEGNSFDLRILGGCTGSGKTEILHEIIKRGHQVIDLEKIAHHKGSAFGAIGEGQQPSNEQFENDLYEAFRALDLRHPIWIENESRSIGRVYIPETLWWKMRSSTLYSITVGRDIRLRRAMEYYTSGDVTELRQSFEKIKKRLGGLDYQTALKALEENDLEKAAEIALKYYDKSYTYQLSQWHHDHLIHLEDCDEVSAAADKLLEAALQSVENK